VPVVAAAPAPGTSPNAAVSAIATAAPGTRPAKRSRAASAASAAPPAAAPAVDVEGPGADEERWFLGMATKIVGVQFYNGVVTDREGVVLQREPNNPYDRNAIQVMNMRNQQIGHCPREMAAVLAPVMDSLRPSESGDGLRIEGYIPRGAGNTFSIPLQLSIFGHDEGGSLAPRVRQLGDQLGRTFCTCARGSVEIVRSQHNDGTPVSQLDDRTWRSIYGGKPPKRQVAAVGPSLVAVMERELENIFRVGGGLSYEAMPEAAVPTGLRVELYAHQLKALHWMRERERGATIAELLAEASPAMIAAATAASATASQVFFWTKEVTSGGGVVYRNVATNSAFKQPPRLPKGGILADDMGLGKTATVLALVLSDGREGAAVAAGPAPVGRLPCRNLVVCPLSVLYNWMEQIRLHAPSLHFRVYHGPDRDRSPQAFAGSDVTLTTYDVVRAEAKDAGRGLAVAHWHRIVLDEAHVIKGHRTATAKAVFDGLSADRRWCLTGTPIQNSVEDVFSLARFLGLEPFNKFEWFNRTLLRPLKSRDPVGFERLQVLLKTWCLRRTKDMRVGDPEGGPPRPLLRLPRKTLEVLRVPLDAGDRALYDRLFDGARAHVKKLERDSALGANYSQVLSMLTRLRQLCCASSLLPSSLMETLRNPDNSGMRVVDAAIAQLGKQHVDGLLQALADAQDDDCSICLMPGCDVVTHCGHIFHRVCAQKAIAELGRRGTGACPLCRRPIKSAELIEKPEYVELGGEEDPEKSGGGGPDGAKIRAVLDFLTTSVVGKADDALGKPHKAVVFSQFTSVLSLLAASLAKKGLAHVRLDGSMAHDKRVQTLQTFADHGHVQVMLCSLKAAGVGLNLTSADHVLLIDPWWNPSVEDQAIDRAHRLGQHRPVRAVRFVAERTVEERILGLHAQKREIMDGALGSKSREELQRMRLDLVSSIFEPFDA